MCGEKKIIILRGKKFFNRFLGLSCKCSSLSIERNSWQWGWRGVNYMMQGNMILSELFIFNVTNDDYITIRL